MKYNKILEEINTLIWEKHALLGARALRPIKQAGLFALDVNDPSWEDVEIEKETAVSPWLCDKEMHKEIRLVLQLDQCEKEERRIKAERGSIQEWFAEE